MSGENRHIIIPDDDYKQPYRKIKVAGRNVDEHRYLMEQALGRKLARNEVVHHKNGNKLDNRLENLEVMDMGQHSRIHNQIYPDIKVCAVCGKMFIANRFHRQRAKVCSETCRREICARSSRKPVVQLEKDGTYVRTWTSAQEAAKALRGERTSIVICLKGRTKTALGFKWRYANEGD